jgi:hypothetical protein
MNRPAKVWPLLKDGPDPRVRSYLTHRLGPLGADAKLIVNRLDEEPDVTIRPALPLSLGEFGESEFSPAARKALLPKLRDYYRTPMDPGVHASVEWLMRQWKQESWLEQVNDEWGTDTANRRQRLDGIGQALAKAKEKGSLQWYPDGGVEAEHAGPGRHCGRRAGPHYGTDRTKK